MASLRIVLLMFGIVSLTHAAQLKKGDPKKQDADEAVLSTLDSKTHKGQIVSIDGKELVFGAGAGEQTFELTKLNAIDFTPKDPVPQGAKWITVELLDGSHFHCSDFKIKNKMAILTLLGLNQTVEFQASTILYMVRDLSEPKLNQAFRTILAGRGKRDIWIVPKNETLDGINGTFGDGDAKGETINFEQEGSADKINIQMPRIYGMIFNPPPIPVAQTICKVTDAAKNSIYAKALTITEKKTFVVESVTGVRVEYPSVASLSKLDFSAGSVLYLSNADPIKVELDSTDGPAEPYRRDHNLDNNDLKINNQKFPKGIALHSRTVLTYDLGGKYKLFQATAGVDDSVEGDSSAILIIEADFKPIFKDVIKKGNKPKELNLAMLNVKQLRITVESEFLDLGNQVDLGNAKLLK